MKDRLRLDHVTSQTFLLSELAINITTTRRKGIVSITFCLAHDGDICIYYMFLSPNNDNYQPY